MRLFLFFQKCGNGGRERSCPDLPTWVALGAGGRNWLDRSPLVWFSSLLLSPHPHPALLGSQESWLLSRPGMELPWAPVSTAMAPSVSFSSPMWGPGALGNRVEDRALEWVLEPSIQALLAGRGVVLRGY